jgi:hypothetical protein
LTFLICLSLQCTLPHFHHFSVFFLQQSGLHVDVFDKLNACAPVSLLHVLG